MNKILKYVLIIVFLVVILGIVGSILNAKKQKQNETTNAQNGDEQQLSKSISVFYDNGAKFEIYKGKPSNEVKRIFMNCKDFSTLLADDQKLNEFFIFCINKHQDIDLIVAKPDKIKKRLIVNDYLYGNYLSQYNQRKIKLIMLDQWSSEDVKYEVNRIEDVTYGKNLLLRCYKSFLFNVDNIHIGNVYMLELEAFDGHNYG